MGENGSHTQMLIESNIAISIVWYIFIFNSMKTVGFEHFPLPYRIFQFAGEFMIGVPPKSDYYWIKTLPCYSIKDCDSNPKSRSWPLFPKCISFSLFYTRMPGPLACLYIVSSSPTPTPPPPLLSEVTSLQLKSTTDRNLAKQQLVFQYQSRLFWDFMLSSPCFPLPFISWYGHVNTPKRQLVTSG